MRIANEITTRLVNKAYENIPPKSEILFNQKATEKVISGAFLELAVQLNNHYLLFMTNDCPFEECLNIHLLDQDMKVLDSASLFWMYSTGSFSLLELKKPDRVYFKFFGHTDWYLKVLSKLSFRVPFLSEPIGVNRTFGFTRHFVIYQDK